MPPSPTEMPNDAQKVLPLVVHRKKQVVAAGPRDWDGEQRDGNACRPSVGPCGGGGGQGHKLGVPSSDGEEAQGSGEGSSDIALGHYILSTRNSAPLSWAGRWQ